MNVERELRNTKLPKKFRRNGSACFLDPYRKKLVQITTEEIVRQRVARYFIKHLCVPFDCVHTEQPTKRYGGLGRGRMDIVVETILGDGAVQPIACVECKADHIELTDHVRSQAERYATELGLEYYFITNGIDMFGYVRDRKSDSFDLLEVIPTFESMLDSKHIVARKEMDTKRTEYNMLGSIDPDDYRVFIGADAPYSLYRDIVNLAECFLDTATRLKAKDYGYFRLIEDIGVRFLGYGDASGSDFGTGKYRTFVIEDKNGNNQLISIGVMPNAKTSGDPKFGNRRGNSVLVVAIDDYQKTHTSLQLNMSDFLRQGDDYTDVIHSGRIAIGNIGSGKIAELKELIRMKAPDLMKDDEIYLGKFRNDRLVYINDNDIELLISKMITYALIRDEYREIKKKTYIPKKSREQKKELFIKRFFRKR